MNFGSPLATAIVRGAYQAALNFGAATLVTRQLGLSWEEALIAGGLLVITSLGGRAAVEGTYDQLRR